MRFVNDFDSFEEFEVSSIFYVPTFLRLSTATCPSKRAKTDSTFEIIIIKTFNAYTRATPEIVLFLLSLKIKNESPSPRVTKFPNLFSKVLQKMRSN